MKLVAGLCALFLVAGCSMDRESADVSASSPGRAGVFSWSRDDLGEWITDDEMTAQLEYLAPKHFGSALDGEAVSQRNEDDWVWSFHLTGDAEGWRLIAHNGDHDGDGATDAALTRTDLRLPLGVVYEAAWGFAHGSYLLSGPGSGESICVTVLPPGTSFGYPEKSDVRVHEDRTFALASVMLREMGWAP